jgi:phosphatidylserine decarboxylase
MGSTVILLFQKDRAHWHDDLRAGATVRLGQSLGMLE